VKTAQNLLRRKARSAVVLTSRAAVRGGGEMMSIRDLEACNLVTATVVRFISSEENTVLCLKRN
jgi:hypothetical protein